VHYSNFEKEKNIDGVRFYHDFNLKIEPDITDSYYTVDVPRLDIISYRVYGTPEFWWVIALCNGKKHALDINFGEVLRIPLKERINKIINKK